MSTAHSAGTSAQAFALLASRTRPPGCSGSSSGHVFLAGGGSGHFRGLEKPGRARPHVVCWRAQGECRFVQSRAVVSACSLLSNSLQPPGLLCQWDYPGKNTGVGGHFLLQTQHAWCPYKKRKCGDIKRHQGCLHTEKRPCEDSATCKLQEKPTLLTP